jgi:hypothetical protein
VFNNGTEYTDKGEISLGGQIIPNSTVGDKEES